MNIGSHRLLGFAFANADLLLEIAPDGGIAFAVGAAEALSGASDADLVGRGWRDFVEAGDRPMIEALFDGLEAGQRGGPVIVRLASDDGVPRAAAFSAFRLPQNKGAISCALARAAPEAAPPAGALHDRETFEQLASTLLNTARSTGAELELAMVELAGIGAARDKAAPDKRKDLETRLSGVLRAQAHGGQAATELGDDRFALVRSRGEAAEALVRRMAKLLDAGLEEKITAAANVIPMKGEADSKRAMRALRYSLDSFLREGLAGEAAENLSEVLSRAVHRTIGEVGALGEAIRERNFRLAFQPVVSLKDGGLHHYEALVRFGEDESPFPHIRMAEEMDLIEPLDLAVLEQAVTTMARDPALSLAVNVSGRTIMSPAYVKAACRLIGAHADVRGRLLFELTESAAIEDLRTADRHLQALRGEGCHICLDDFGAGAASLAYLQQLGLDVVKIDGRYIRDLQRGGREATFVKHLVKMCGELGIRTLAEMVETQETEAAVRAAGVDLAQGFRYGAASEIPAPPIKAKPGRNQVRPALRA
ncbi:EAL domain-containing protein [Phenylobacterium soli]|uniref:EAL domain-containing protein n=1 Tax=Phenylobacterium soli TaxID=2170551 RepID=A0A328AIN8_9CAUL|nr:EAL domain-containing protein [Phenylobacterium soli]RAK54692.1 EAL domain-containing protein [Phenylobacterium soli]